MSNIIDFPAPPQRSAIGVGFYKPVEAARIARVPRTTLNDWRRKRIVMESIEWQDEEGRRESGYTFEGLVFLRLIRMLRESQIGLRRAVLTVSELSKRCGPPGPEWEAARIFSWGRDVFVYVADEWMTTTATRSSQRAADVLFGEEFSNLRDRSDALLVPRKFQRYVEIDPSRKNGQPVVVGTTIPTSVIHAFRNRGLSFADIRHEYPFISIQAATVAHRFEQFLDLESAA